MSVPQGLTFPWEPTIGLVPLGRGGSRPEHFWRSPKVNSLSLTHFENLGLLWLRGSHLFSYGPNAFLGVDQLIGGVLQVLEGLLRPLHCVVCGDGIRAHMQQPV